MKLKELLLSMDFEALIPALKKEGSLTIRQYRVTIALYRYHT